MTLRSGACAPEKIGFKRSRNMQVMPPTPYISKYLLGNLPCLFDIAHNAKRSLPKGRLVLPVEESHRFLSDPPLSSIILDVEKSGYEAARLMQKMIMDKNKNYPDIIVQPTTITTRQSTDIYSTNDKVIVNALKYIHLNIDKNLTVSKVLQEVPLSRRSLEKRFIQTTGYPVYKYIYHLRIEKFMEKLLNTEMTITEIAHDLGLSDTKNIARLFKQVQGLSPLEYRKKYSIKK